MNIRDRRKRGRLLFRKLILGVKLSKELRLRLIKPMKEIEVGLSIINFLLKIKNSTIFIGNKIFRGFQFIIITFLILFTFRIRMISFHEFIRGRLRKRLLRRHNVYNIKKKV